MYQTCTLEALVGVFIHFDINLLMSLCEENVELFFKAKSHL